MPDLTDTGNTKITTAVNEWFQTLPRPELQQMDRYTLILDLQMVFAAELRQVRAEVAEEIACELEASSFESQMDADFAARIARQHATT
jgi:hypothetical protein